MIDSAPYIDKRNVALWKELNRSDFSIVIEESNEPNYGCYCQKKDATIYVLTSKPDPASFAHELLHIWLKYIKKVCVSGALRFFNSSPAGIFFDDGLHESIANNMEHSKILPLFIKMGYRDEDFISDYFMDKLQENELRDIERNLKTGLFRKAYNIAAVRYYIGKFIAVMADNNSINYKSRLERLKSLEPNLYSILDAFWSAWQSYDINSDNILDEYYIVHNFVESIEGWMSDKKFV